MNALLYSRGGPVAPGSSTIPRLTAIPKTHGMHEAQEHVSVVIEDDHDVIARLIAHRIAEIIRSRREEGRNAVLGLATGSTPIGIYRELIRLHRDEGLDFSNVVTFNLDEHFPMSPDSVHSYHRFMCENLFDHVNIRRENVHLLRGDLRRSAIEEHA